MKILQYFIKMNPIFKKVLFFILVKFCLILSISCSPAKNQQIYKSIKNMEGIKKIQFKNVVEQGYDWSCGVASLSTVLIEGFGDMVDQVELINEIDKIYMEKETRDKGLSLSEIAQVAINRGYSVTAKQVNAEQVKRIGLPVIIKIDLYDGPHFVILKGNGIVKNQLMEYAFIVDPSNGNKKIPFYQFKSQFLGKNNSATALLIHRFDNLWIKNSTLFVEK